MELSQKHKEYIKKQFVKIEDARSAICETMHEDCGKCPLNRNDKCGEIKHLGVFNTDTMELEPLESDIEYQNDCAFIDTVGWCSKVEDFCKMNQNEVDCCRVYEQR